MDATLYLDLSDKIFIRNYSVYYVECNIHDCEDQDVYIKNNEKHEGDGRKIVRIRECRDRPSAFSSSS
jgi:hypothetical protein